MTARKGRPGSARRRASWIGAHKVVLIDSITQVVAADAGCIVVSGSHGGHSAAAFAARVSARLYAFNDAGIGKDEAGIGGLAMLQAEGLAACAVSHESARIGDAADALDNGVVSAANAAALQLGIGVGRPLKSCLAEGEEGTD